MGLYAEGHPARERVIDTSFGLLQRLQEKDPTPQFSFLGLDVIYGQVALRELKEWDWGLRLAEAGVQRLEFAADTGRDEYEAFLGDVLARLIPQAIDSSTRSPERRSTIKFGAIGVKGSEGVMRPEELLPTATIQYSLGEEADTIRWLHEEVQISGELPLIEAESVVRSLSVAMHGDRDIVIPLLQLKEFDQYTTTHSLNVSARDGAGGVHRTRAEGRARLRRGGTAARPREGAHSARGADEAGQAHGRGMDDHAPSSRRRSADHL
jgi:hypothetical protein